MPLNNIALFSLEQKQVWTMSDLNNKTQFEEDTKAGGWIGSNKKLNEYSKDADDIGRLALEYTNKFREAHKLPPLKWHQSLAHIGLAHSKGMGEGNVPFSHQGFDNRVKQMPGRIWRICQYIRPLIFNYSIQCRRKSGNEYWSF